MLSFPEEHKTKQQHRRTDGANGVEDVRDSDRIHPWHHCEDEDGAEKIARERKRDEGVADDLHKTSELSMISLIL